MGKYLDICRGMLPGEFVLVMKKNRGISFS